MSSNKILRVKIQDFLRKTHLLGLAENARYYQKLWSLKKRNNLFIAANPGFALPPEYLAFDAYSAPDWNFYKTSGEGTAGFLQETVKKYRGDQPVSSVYEWGCGPGRIIRHLPAEFGSSVQIHGSDYNPKTIEWLEKNISGVRFTLNELNPPLSYPDDTFDFIYAISVFTHLSESTGLDWAAELYRVLKPGGILLITTSGDSAYEKEMLEKEKEQYQKEGVLIKGNYEEGKKMYLSRHTPRYVRERLLKQFEILEHAPSGFPFIAQDYWIARKNG